MKVTIVFNLELIKVKKKPYKPCRVRGKVTGGTIITE